MLIWPCQHREGGGRPCGASESDRDVHPALHAYVRPAAPQRVWALFGCACCGRRVKTRDDIERCLTSSGACRCCGSSVWIDGIGTDDMLADFKSRHKIAIAHYATLSPDQQI